MKAIQIICLVLLFSVLNGCVMVKNEEWTKLQADMADIKRDAEDSKKAKEALRQQTEEMKRTIDALKSQIQGIEKSTGTQLSTRLASAEKAFSDSEKEIRKKQADLAADITMVRSDFQVLTGRFEETRYSLQKGIQEGKGFKEETDLKLKEAAQGLEEIQKRLAALEQAVALIRQDRDQNKEPSSGKAAETMSSEDAYKDAYDTFQKGDYKAARDKLHKYVETYPASKYTENALYWIGECSYSEKNYERAIVEFDDVVKKYPSGTKAPAALLKQGLAFSSLKDRKSAHAIFKKVMERYPKSEQAGVAKKRLKE